MGLSLAARYRQKPERGGNTVDGVRDFGTDNGSSQGQNLSVNGLFNPSSFSIPLEPRVE